MFCCRQLDHGRELTFPQPGQQHDLTARQFERVVMHGWAYLSSQFDLIFDPPANPDADGSNLALATARARLRSFHGRNQ